MKRRKRLIYIGLALTLVIITFVNLFIEQFENINPKAFNFVIENRTDIKTPEQLIALYYKQPNAKNDFKLYNEMIDDNTFKIKLINEALDDDSILGEKIIMIARLNNGKWKVLEIRKNWKCQPGRNFISKWGIDTCS